EAEGAESDAFRRAHAVQEEFVLITGSMLMLRDDQSAVGHLRGDLGATLLPLCQNSLVGAIGPDQKAETPFAQTLDKESYRERQPLVIGRIQPNEMVAANDGKGV